MLHTVSADTVKGTEVTNSAGEDLGKIEDVMLDFNTNQVAYFVLSFGGVFGTTMGDKRFAVPMQAFTVIKDDDGDITYRLDVSKEFLKSAPGFDKDDYPDYADSAFTTRVGDYYRSTIEQMRRVA